MSDFSLTPMPIKTKFGLEQYEILYRQREAHKDDPLGFAERCRADASTLGTSMEFFIEDEMLNHLYPMDTADVTGWKINNEVSDMITILNYFGKPQTH